MLLYLLLKMTYSQTARRLAVFNGVWILASTWAIYLWGHPKN